MRLAAALSARGVTVRGLVDPLVPMLRRIDKFKSESAFISAT